MLCPEGVIPNHMFFAVRNLGRNRHRFLASLGMHCNKNAEQLLRVDCNTFELASHYM